MGQGLSISHGRPIDTHSQALFAKLNWETYHWQEPEQSAQDDELETEQSGGAVDEVLQSPAVPDVLLPPLARDVPQVVQDWERRHKVCKITAKEWEVQRETFTRLYVAEDRSLDDVRRIMAERNGFFANRKQCKSAIKKWNLEKNLRKPKALAMLRIKDRRAQKGKRTAFKHNGQFVDEENLQRARKRHRGGGVRPAWEELRSPVGTPLGVEYWTPPGTPGDTGVGDRVGQGAEDGVAVIINAE